MHLSDFLGKFKVCSEGHNEVMWCKENHPKGCPVCASKEYWSKFIRQDNRDADISAAIANRISAESELNDKKCEVQALTCKLRDANIEIEKLKNHFATEREFGSSMSKKFNDLLPDYRKLQEEVEGWKSYFNKIHHSCEDRCQHVARLKKELKEAQGVAQACERMVSEKGSEIETLKAQVATLRDNKADCHKIYLAPSAQWCEKGHRGIYFNKMENDRCPVCQAYDTLRKMSKENERLEGELKCAFDHRQSFGAKDEVDVMKDDYIAMRKQRDDLLVENEQWKHSYEVAFTGKCNAVKEIQELKNAINGAGKSSMESGREFMLNRRVFELEGKVCRLTSYNSELNKQNQQVRRNMKLMETSHRYGISKEQIEQLSAWIRSQE
jgi:hypothetical protein